MPIFFNLNLFPTARALRATDTIEVLLKIENLIHNSQFRWQIFSQGYRFQLFMYFVKYEFFCCFFVGKNYTRKKYRNLKKASVKLSRLALCS